MNKYLKLSVVIILVIALAKLNAMRNVKIPSMPMLNFETAFTNYDKNKNISNFRVLLNRFSKIEDDLEKEQGINVIQGTLSIYSKTSIEYKEADIALTEYYIEQIQKIKSEILKLADEGEEFMIEAGIVLAEKSAFEEKNNELKQENNKFKLQHAKMLEEYNTLKTQLENTKNDFNAFGDTKALEAENKKLKRELRELTEGKK